MSEQQPLFVAVNRHVASCGEPPHVDAGGEGKYYGYFENEHGEQWVFVYDRESESGILQGGDAGWQQKFKVVGGVASGLILDGEESQWLSACWRAATAFKEYRQEQHGRR